MSKYKNVILNMKKYLAITKRIMWRPSFPKEVIEEGKRYLHLGCGPVDHPSFINIDALPFPHIHYIRPIDKLYNFTSNSVDLIYASHCLEHFSYKEVSKVLDEWFRILKKGGVLRLSVPDFDKIIDIYKNNGNSIASIISPLMGGQNYKYNFHMVVFNYDYLRSHLENVGFTEIRHWMPGSDDLTSFDDWSSKKIKIDNNEYEISLNIEASK